jgi:serine protease
MNLSLGGPGSCSQAEQATFDLARQAGVVVVVAAGNESQDAAFSSPANCDNVITVSAVDIDASITPYSNFGATIDVAAPGGDSSKDRNGDGYPDGVLSTAADDSSGSIVFTYPFFQGTSMASPHMAGVIALMKSANPLLTPSQIDQMLDNGELTDDIGDPDLYGNGLINARKAVFAALNAAGTPPNDDPRLSVTPRSLNFGISSTVSEFTVRNTGGGSIQASPPSSNESWLTVVPVSVSAENLGTYAVTVDRGVLAPGVYSDTITVQSNVNTVDLSVIMQVGAAFEADAGYLYLLLINRATGNVVQQLETTASGGLYPPFQFTSVPEGLYELIAGTDSDNDFLICDSGEACGSYLTLDQPQDILLDQNLTGLDFSVAHVIAIPNQSLDAETEPRRVFRRMIEPAHKQVGR